MEGDRDENMLLDYAVFHISPTQNSYEALACSQGKTEKIAVGPLDQLALHLREASRPLGNSFKLQVTKNLNGSSWFTKSTLERFLHIVNTPEVVKSINAIENEMSQLEETKRFQLTLHAKDHPDQYGGGTSDSLKETRLTKKQQVKVESALPDATKNELLRAMDLRLVALEEELGASFNRAAGATCSTGQVSDLVAFAQHFGQEDLRNCLMKYLALISKHQSDFSVDQSSFSHNPRNTIETKTEDISELVQLIDTIKPLTNGACPAKIALAERQSPTESEESSQSSDEDRPLAERSRTLIRSASPRRSASPMRRVQIGRSGSRRSTALTIKSLSFFPARERPLNRDADGTNSGDEESEQPAKKPESTVRRMSVQDAINLFESKQKDQILDVPKRKPVAEASSVSTSKSVLRRWSSGMSDSFTNCSNVDASDAGAPETPGNTILEAEEKESIEIKAGSDSLEGNEVTASMDGSAELVIPKAEEINGQATASAEWNRQKEAELNQMLMKMMETKPGKYRGANPGNGGSQDTSGEQRGGFYSQYKEKRDEKLRAENTRLRATKEAQFKVMQETLEQSKAQMASKTGKQDSLNHFQRPRRNSAPPPVLPKKEISPKPAVSRKASPRSSSLPKSAPMPRTVTPPAKPSPGAILSNSTPTRKKPQRTPSPAKASPRREIAPTKGTRTDAKPSLRSPVEKQQKAPAKAIKSVKTRSPSAPVDDSGVKSAKPSFYNKVTKKSSVVPVESKPFLRKGTKIVPGVGPVLAKPKVSQSDDSSKNSGNLVQAEEIEPTDVTAEPVIAPVEDDVIDAKLEVPPPVVNNLNQETREEAPDKSLETVESSFHVSEIQPDEDMGISASAWVEVEPPEVSASCDNGLPGITTSPGFAPVPSSSPRIRHSLSQMLLAETSEPDTIEWGNAENPPALVYQKDAPKGFKRLLKFARKNKGDTSATGWSSPSVFSEGEDDPEESRAASKRSSDTLMRKAALQAKAYGQQRNVLSESFDGDSKRPVDVFSARSSMNHIPDKLREGHISATAASTKATRSFFSLSTFRSGKSSEAKLR